MKKKLVVVAMLLFAICFTGFAKEAITAESSQYIAKTSTKGSKEKEYTFTVAGKVKTENGWILKKETFRIIDTSLSSAQQKAKDKFVRMYGYSKVDTGSVTIVCESTKNMCRLEEE